MKAVAGRGVRWLFPLLFLIVNGSVTAAAQSGAPVNVMRTIDAVAVVELLKNESPESAGERIRPLAAVANLSLEPIGFRLRIAKIEVAGEIPGETTYELLRELASAWSTRREDRDIVIAFTNAVRNDQSLGLAMPMTACRPSQAFASIAYGGPAAEALERAGRTLAHELGHFLGAGHDPRSILENGLFSIMYPYAVALTGGFSAYSKAQIDSFTAPGADNGRCFREEVVEYRPLEILGAGEIRTAEGEIASERYSVFGSNDPVWFHAERLPYGAIFDPARGILAYRPDASIAQLGAARSFEVLLVAETFLGRKEKMVRIVVEDSTPPVPPNFFPETILVGAKGKVKFSLHFPGDTKLSCERAPKGLKISRKKNTAKISGKIRGSGVIRCSGRQSGTVREITFLR